MSGTDAGGNPIRMSVGRATTPDYWCSAHPGRRALSRDNVAAMAMQGAMANTDVLSRLEEEPTERFTRNVAGLAYEVADAMLTEAAKERP
jgi:hypothetical protein